MSGGADDHENPSELRRDAEEEVARERAAQPSDASAALSPEEAEAVLHELRVHQIELEVQNEDLRAAQAEIEAARARYFDLYDLAPVGYCTLSEQGIILEANSTFATLVGTVRSAVAKQPISHFIHRDDQDTYYLRRRRMLQRNEPQDFELRMIRADQSVFWAQMRQAPVRTTGEESAWRLVIADISARKDAEEENDRLHTRLAQAGRMEAVGRMAGGVAHDFNNMLGVILGNAEIAMNRISVEAPLYRELDEIRKAANRSADLTRTLLTFARHQVIAPKVLDLNAVVDGVLELTRSVMQENITFEWRPGSSIWPLKMDPTQLDRLVANLCLNARDAIDGVGRIVVETKNEVLVAEDCSGQEVAAPGEYVVLSVSDDGCGMDRETELRIFDPFFTTKKFGEGTGLGLATVYGIVNQNGGLIRVHSTPGQGTTFSIFLPRHEGCASPEADRKTAPGITRGHETILLVENEPALLRMASTVLQKQGYQVLTASTPSEALRIIAEPEHRIDLLLTDLIMPEMNGRDLASRIRDIQPGLKALIMSGNIGDMAGSEPGGGDEPSFLQKPFSLGQLGRSLRELLDS